MDPDSSQIQNLLTWSDYTAAAVIAADVFLTAYFACTEQASEIISRKADHIGSDARQKQRLSDLYKGVTDSTFKSFHAIALCAAAACCGILAWGRTSFIAAALISFAAGTLIWCIADSMPRLFIKDENAEKVMIGSAVPVSILKVLMMPLSALMQLLSGANRREPVTEEEIMHMVEAGNESGGIEESEREMINNVFEFHDTAVEEVMTHRTDVVAVDISDDISDIVYTAINSGFSRIPVCEKNIDHIVGIIHVKDLLCLVGVNDMSSFSVKSFVREAQFVPESCMCDELFKTFTAQRTQFAVVVDEYGGTSGIVTMEDIVESIFGSIQDEYDNEDEDIFMLSENVFIIDGNADPEDVFERLGLEYPDDFDYDTIGAFVTSLVGHLPEDEEHPEVKYEDVLFSVILAEDMKIEKIKAEKITADPTAENTDNAE